MAERTTTTSGSLLPEDLEEHAIGGMMVGESAWTTPWAMWADRDRRLWLNADYTIHSDPGGTVSMLVQRRGDGYHLDITRCGWYRWSVGDSPWAKTTPVASLTR